MKVYKRYFLLMASACIFLVGFFSCVGNPVLENAIPIDTLYPLTNLSKQVKETSGLFVLDGRIWTFNDSGDKARLYQISMVSGKVERKVKIAKANNVDWESVTTHNNKIYLGDTGNNKGNRDELTIYEIAEKDLLNTTLVECPVLRKIKYRYPLKHGFPDCEAMVIKSNRLYLFTKDRPQGSSQIYSLDLLNPEAIAVHHQTLNTGALITAAHRDSLSLYLLGYEDGFVRRPIIWVYPWLGSDLPEIANGRAYYFKKSIQSEGITGYKSDAFIISSEGSKSQLPRLWSFTLETPIPE